MPWTESRSRDEWLAEVRRRGERIRRRRRLAGSLVGVIALLVPALAVASVLTGDQGSQDLRVATSGPASPPTSAVVGETTTTQPESTSPTATELRAPVTTIRGNATPADDPVARQTTTTAAPRPATTTTAPDVVASTTVPPPAVTVPTTAPTPGACPVPNFLVIVTTDKESYALGETVTFHATVRNGTPITCSLPGGAYFSVHDATGRPVGPPVARIGGNNPVVAVSGHTQSFSNSWDQQDCLVKDSSCVQARAGTYTVRVESTPTYGFSYSGTATFGVGT